VGVGLVKVEVAQQHGPQTSLYILDVREVPLHFLVAVIGDFFGNGEQKVFLGPEILVDGRLGDASLLADLVMVALWKPFSAKMWSAASMMRSFLDLVLLCSDIPKPFTTMG
jgi:hypothetical protein